MLPHRGTAQLSVASVALLLCMFISSASLEAADTASTNSTTNSTSNFNCPEDCHCVLAHHTHIPFLHAKCSSLNGLKSEEPLQATLPIHSIDLSYLSLPRLSHSLDKLPDVTSIDLSHNELHEFGHLGRRIKKLNLKHNRITSSKLSKLPEHVQVLNLHHNDITYLPLEFTKLMQLHTLELSHNEINCSCETLSVRNWLQERRVFMENPVKCSYPAEAKGKSWLQVKQSDICEKEKRGWLQNEDENELMLGDQPVEGSGNHEDNDEEELGKDYLPIDKKTTSSAKSSEQTFDDVEGSGELGETNMELKLSPSLAKLEEKTTEMPQEEEEEDGSGSGAGPIIMPHGTLVIDDFETPDSAETDDKDDFDNKPLEQPTPEATPSPDIFDNVHMGIYGGDADKTDSPVEEEVIVPVVHHIAAAENVPNEDVITDGPFGQDESESEAIKHAKVGEQDDSNATYFLLGVIVLIVVGLMLYVGIKRYKSQRGAAHDAENQRQTELLDMDKKHPGKPIQRNGNENVPLIGEKSKSDLAKPVNGANKKPYDSNDIKDGPAQQQQPLINGNGAAPTDDIPKINAPTSEQPPHEYYPITPRYPTPKSPRASKYAQYPQAGTEHNNNTQPDDAYLSSSPKSGRYSPVYSPETGKVKIKLTETPRPKTPMLVTRSKSNAGDIITTPVRPGGTYDDTPVAVHIVPAVGTANGRVEH